MNEKRKLILCKHYFNGNCTFGSKCLFSHETQPHNGISNTVDDFSTAENDYTCANNNRGDNRDCRDCHRNNNSYNNKTILNSWIGGIIIPTIIITPIIIINMIIGKLISPIIIIIMELGTIITPIIDMKFGIHQI